MLSGLNVMQATYSTDSTSRHMQAEYLLSDFYKLSLASMYYIKREFPNEYNVTSLSLSNPKIAYIAVLKMGFHDLNANSFFDLRASRNVHSTQISEYSKNISI